MNFTGKSSCVNCGKEMSVEGGDFSPAGSVHFRSCACGMKALFYTSSNELVYGFRSKTFYQEKQDIETSLINCFTNAGVLVLSYRKIINEYCEDHFPWLLVTTKIGLVKIGWRKRVIYIDWSDTGISYLIKDDVTKNEYMAHALGYEKATEYLKEVFKKKSLFESLASIF